MSMRPADARFALPRPVATARVLGELSEWADALRAAGVRVLDSDEDANAPVDLVVAPPALGATAAASPTNMVIVTGPVARRHLRRAGFHAERLLFRPGPVGPRLLVPLDHREALRYVLRRWSVPGARRRQARNRVLLALLELGAPPGRATVTLGLRRHETPFLVAAAAELGVPEGAGWFLALGVGDELQRAVFHLFAPGEPTPGWVLKFGRVPGYDDPFRRDEQGLSLVAAAGSTSAAHAPRLLGRLDVHGLQGLVETAAVGQALNALLDARGPADRKRHHVDAIATWIVALGRESATDTDTLARERERLEQEVLPRWRAQGAPEDLVSSLPPLPGVLQHNDLGSWNVVVTDRDFTAVDWESARRPGLPLWDLLYFLADALVALDGPAPAEVKVSRAVRLFRGELPASPALFGWIRHAVEEQRIQPDAVGAIATLCWMHHGLSHHARREALELAGGPGRPAGAPAVLGHLGRLAAPWLADPLLGPGWDRWRL